MAARHGRGFLKPCSWWDFFNVWRKSMVVSLKEKLCLHGGHRAVAIKNCSFKLNVYFKQSFPRKILNHVNYWWMITLSGRVSGFPHQTLVFLAEQAFWKHFLNKVGISSLVRRTYLCMQLHGIVETISWHQRRQWLVQREIIRVIFSHI